MSWAGGDWMCSACQHLNFKKRDTCQRCEYPKYGGPDPSTYICNRTEVLAGDWYCNCGAHNYASRPNCFRCSAMKNDYGGAYSMMPSAAYGSDGSSPPGWKSGDWMCIELDVECTITRVGQNASNAKHQEIMVCNTCSILIKWCCLRKWSVEDSLMHRLHHISFRTDPSSNAAHLHRHSHSTDNCIGEGFLVSCCKEGALP
ncbi:unnamed protein product [Prunus armeniaca]|uniref:RanBP2-type domain-containing protein n=1 Tax=Prunus armeniaca TaxID=36596 RepID=A0A6J5XZ13_PRUAR|nr:unnamed protein product [Prunus armeniaca]